MSFLTSLYNVSEYSKIVCEKSIQYEYSKGAFIKRLHYNFSRTSTLFTKSIRKEYSVGVFYMSIPNQISLIMYVNNVYQYSEGVFMINNDIHDCKLYKKLISQQIYIYL